MITKDDEAVEIAAEEWPYSNECEVMDTFAAHRNSFKAGVAWRDEQVQVLIDALERIANPMPPGCWPMDIAAYALKQWRGEK